MEEFQLIKSYRDDAQLRASLNALTRRVFHFDFEAWYRSGFWGDSYLPYSFLAGDQVAANVSVNRMCLLWNGEEKAAIQLGTVMTAPEYRGRGLIRRLMEMILKEYGEQAEFFYLFANPSVVDFYPKFGFRHVQEHQCEVALSEAPQRPPLRRLNLAESTDAEILKRLALRHVPVSPVLSHACGDPGLLMFYCGGPLRDSLFYLPQEDIIAVAEEEDGALSVLDIFSAAPFSLESVLGAFAGKYRRALLGFSPGPLEEPDTVYRDDNDILFMRPACGDFSRAMFPVLSRA